MYVGHGVVCYRPFAKPAVLHIVPNETVGFVFTAVDREREMPLSLLNPQVDAVSSTSVPAVYHTFTQGWYRPEATA